MESILSTFPCSTRSSPYSWEYPNKQGIGCNIISPQDSANFLQFLRQLRQDPIGRNLYLSAAVGITPFMGPDGTPMEDVSAFAEQLDHIGALSDNQLEQDFLQLYRDYELRYLGIMVKWHWSKRSP